MTESRLDWAFYRTEPEKELMAENEASLAGLHFWEQGDAAMCVLAAHSERAIDVFTHNL